MQKEKHKNPSNVSHEKEADFVRKLKRGCGKYKGKLHFRCIKCCRVGHFSSKWPFKECIDTDSDEELDHKE